MFGIVSTAQKVLIGVLLAVIASLVIYAFVQSTQKEIAQGKLDIEKINSANYQRTLITNRAELKRKIASLESIQEIERERAKKQAARAKQLGDTLDELRKIRNEQPLPGPEINYHSCLGVNRPEPVIRLFDGPDNAGNSPD